MLKRLLSKGVAVRKHGSRKQASRHGRGNQRCGGRARGAESPSRRPDASFPSMAVGGFLCDFAHSDRVARGRRANFWQRRRSAAAAGPTGPWHSRHRLDDAGTRRLSGGSTQVKQRATTRSCTQTPSSDRDAPRVRDALKQQANSKVRKKKKTDEQQEEVRGLSLKYDLTKGVGCTICDTCAWARSRSSFKRYASKKAPQDRCLSLFCAGSKTIDLEVLGDAKERDAFAWAFDKIIGEARATRIFVDKAGAPVARSEPKKRLRMILGAH